MSDRTAFRQILVPVDGSALAETAIPCALAIAERAGSKLQFAMVYGRSFPPAPMRLDKLYLDQLAQRLSEQLGYSPSCELLEGPVAPTLVKHARTIGADLIVMTTHGRGGLERAWLGSVTDQLVRSSGVPVLVVRPSPDGRGATFNPGEIMIPLDGSALAETALSPAAAMAQLWDAEVSLLQVVFPVSLSSEADLQPPGAYDKELTEINRQAAAQYLAEIAVRLRNSGVKASGVAMVGKARLPQILFEQASPGRVGLLAIATHGRGGLRRLMLGSVTDKLVRTAEVPILVVPPVRPIRKAREAKMGDRVKALEVGEEFSYA
jgi:nucleotide-binding universal stress UspA family protein